MKVTCILPAYGRHEQTVDLIPRLLGSTGLKSDEFELIVVVNGEPELAQRLSSVRGIRILNSKTNLGYWGALKVGTMKSNSPILCNLANDLLPGYDWLKRALDAYTLTYKDEGMIGFQDGIRTDQSAHFLIARSMLHRWYGDSYWPIEYVHNHGDQEISLRAKREKKYAIAPFALLFQAHHYMLGGELDDVYRKGQESFEQDMATYEMRKANGWSSVPIAQLAKSG